MYIHEAAPQEYVNICGHIRTCLLDGNTARGPASQAASEGVGRRKVVAAM